MKKIITALTCLLVAVGLSFAQEGAAKDKGSNNGFGARIAFDYGTMYGFDEQDDDVDADPSGIGFEVGVMARIQMIPNLYFAPEVNFAYISTTHEYLKLERTYTSMDLEIPLLFRGIIADKFYITAGPQLVINISNEMEMEKKAINIGGEEQYINLNKENVEESSFGFGLAAGLGYNIVKGLNIDLRVFMGLMELYPDLINQDNAESLYDVETMINMDGAKMMKFKVGISYWFM